jgi:hypothetical protein
MINAVPAIIMLAWSVAIIALSIQSHRLLYAFRERYPAEAESRMEHAFAFRAHPSKFLYFVSAKCAAFLEERKDRSLLSMRRSVIGLCVAAVLILLAGFAGLLILVMRGI